MDAIEFWEILFRIYAVLLALLAVSYWFQRPSSVARPITIISAVIVLVPLVILAIFTRWEWDPF